MSLPDFLIIGAMKCGTSTLHAQLAQQPGIFMSEPKEPNFFSDDEIYAKGLDWYESLFAAAAPGDLKGESSTHYTKLPTYPETLARMAEVLAAPKLIYVMRDPMERAVSHYLHEWSMGVMGKDPVAAFEKHPELISYSCYARQLAPFVAQYGREAVLLLRTEAMRADPQGTLERTGAFLGRPGLVWNERLGAQNVSAERSRRLPFHEVLVDNRVAETLRRSLVPKPVRNWIRESRRPAERPTLPDSLKDRLRGIFEQDSAALAEMFPESAHAA